METGEEVDQGSAPKLGPTGIRVARNVLRSRENAELSLRGLSELLRECGRPILASGILKIEHQKRRVDVDDLMALAIALDVTPIALLLGQVDGGAEVELTPTLTKPTDDAWRWATKGRTESVSGDVRISTLERHREALRPVYAAATEAVEAGVPPHVVLAAARAFTIGYSMTEWFGPGLPDETADTDG